MLSVLYVCLLCCVNICSYYVFMCGCDCEQKNNFFLGLPQTKFDLIIIDTSSECVCDQYFDRPTYKKENVEGIESVLFEYLHRVSVDALQ